MRQDAWQLAPRHILALFLLSVLPLPLLVIVVVKFFEVPLGWALGLAGLIVVLEGAVSLVFLFGQRERVSKLLEPQYGAWLAICAGVLLAVVGLFWSIEGKWLALIPWLGAVLEIAAGLGLLRAARQRHR